MTEATTRAQNICAGERADMTRRMGGGMQLVLDARSEGRGTADGATVKSAPHEQ